MHGSLPQQCLEMGSQHPHFGGIAACCLLAYHSDKGRCRTWTNQRKASGIHASAQHVPWLGGCGAGKEQKGQGYVARMLRTAWLAASIKTPALHTSLTLQ